MCVCVERDMKKRGAAMKGLEKEVRFISFADHVPAPPSVHTHVVVVLTFLGHGSSSSKAFFLFLFLFLNLFLNVRSLTHDGLFRARPPLFFIRDPAHDWGTRARRGTLFSNPPVA